MVFAVVASATTYYNWSLSENLKTDKYDFNPGGKNMAIIYKCTQAGSTANYARSETLLYVASGQTGYAYTDLYLPNGSIPSSDSNVKVATYIDSGTATKTGYAYATIVDHGAWNDQTGENYSALVSQN
jgi:hypothetical protein